MSTETLINSEFRLEESPLNSDIVSLAERCDTCAVVARIILANEIEGCGVLTLDQSAAVVRDCPTGPIKSDISHCGKWFQMDHL